MSLTWKSNNGSVWLLDGSSGVTVVNEAEGVFAMPVDLMIDQRIGDGGVLVHSRRSPLRVVFEFLLVDDVAGSVSALWRSFLVSIAAGGTFEYTGTSGTFSLFKVVLESPDRSMTGHDLAFRPDDVFAVSFLALDPWWYGAPITLSGFGFGAGTGWDAAVSWDASIPWNGGDSVAVNNPGDVDSPLLIDVVGAATEVTFSLSGVGGWTTAVPLGTGERITVTGIHNSEDASVGPHRGSIFAGTIGPADWSLIAPSSQLFDIPMGQSEIIVGASGTDGSSGYSLFWFPRFYTPA